MITRTIKLSVMAATLLLASAVKAQTVDEVIDAHIKAIGGKDKLSAVKTLTIEGTLQTNGMDLPMVVQTIKDVGSRTEIEIMGGKLIQVFSVKGNWMQNPVEIGGSGSPEEMPAEAAKGGSSRYELGGAFLNYKENGKTAKLVGKETVDKVDAFRISLTNKDGSETTYFIDDKNYYIIKTISKVNFRGEDVEVETLLSDYKTLPNGLVMSHKRVSTQGEQERTTTYQKVEYDKPLDAKIFDMPK